MFLLRIGINVYFVFFIFKVVGIYVEVIRVVGVIKN